MLNAIRKRWAKPTPRQQEVLSFLADFMRKNRASPTLREIAVAIGVSSLATVHEHIENLEQKGFIRKYRAVPRNIEIVTPMATHVRGPEINEIKERAAVSGWNSLYELRTDMRFLLARVEELEGALELIQSLSSGGPPSVEIVNIAAEALEGSERDDRQD